MAEAAASSLNKEQRATPIPAPPPNPPRLGYALWHFYSATLLDANKRVLIALKLPNVM